MSIIPVRLIPDNTKINFIGLWRLASIASVILTVTSICFMLIQGINYGIDFAGGLVIEAKIGDSQPDLAQLRHNLGDMNLGEVALQSVGNNGEVLIRISNKQDADFKRGQFINDIQGVVANSYRGVNITYNKVDFVGPQVGKQLVRDGATATILALVAIMFYIWMRFEWQYGVALAISLIHDTILCLGFISLFNLEFNLSAIAAILTVIGYSVNDSVVIYDRIRENIVRYTKISINDILNISINDTLSRTVLTVLTTLLATLSLVVYGGEVIRSFSLIVFAGIIIGTYSSIYISAPILSVLKLDNKQTN
jgi:preprotein translocase subunit SecF